MDGRLGKMTAMNNNVCWYFNRWRTTLTLQGLQPFQSKQGNGGRVQEKIFKPAVRNSCLSGRSITQTQSICLWCHRSRRFAIGSIYFCHYGSHICTWFGKSSHRFRVSEYTGVLHWWQQSKLVCDCFPTQTKSRVIQQVRRLPQCYLRER